MSPSLRHSKAGISLAELAIAQLLMAIIGLALVVLYNQSYMVLNRGSVKTYQQQTAREAVKRIVPRITSAVPPTAQSEDQLEAVLEPIYGAPPSNQIVLYSTEEYVAKTTDQATLPTFDPRQPRYGVYRIFFEIDPDKNQSDPRLAPGGRIGNVLVDAYTPTDNSDDLIIARNLYDVTFSQVDTNIVRLSVTVYGDVEMATGRTELKKVDYTTRVHLPYFTTFPGGG